MTIHDFCEVYNTSSAAVFGLKARGVLPDEIFYKKSNDVLTRINVEYIIRRKEFKRFVRLFNQDTYYFLEEYFNDLQIAQAVSKECNVNKKSFYVYLKHGLFCLDETNITSFKVTETDWIFFKYGRRVRKAMKRRYKGFDIEEILDKRMKK